MFDPPERVPFAKIPFSENGSAGHRQLARAAEREAIVLLKNQGGILPLKSSVKKIAVIGPAADDPVSPLANYNGVSMVVTPLVGIKRQFGPALVREEPRVFFHVYDEEPAVRAAIPGETYSIRWTGTVTPPATGDYIVVGKTQD